MLIGLTLVTAMVFGFRYFEDLLTKSKLIQVDCAQIMSAENRYKIPREQVLTFYYSDGSIYQETRLGLCLQDAQRYEN